MMTIINMNAIQDYRTTWNAPSNNNNNSNSNSNSNNKGNKSPRSVDDSVFHVWQKPDTGFHDLKSKFDDQMMIGDCSLDDDVVDHVVLDENNDDDDNDFIMQLDENEGLLNLNDFHDHISNDRLGEILADAMLTNMDTPDDCHSDDTNSFFSCESSRSCSPEHQHSTTSPSNSYYKYDKTAPPSMSSSLQFQESLHKLSKSMRKSQATRKSLYAKTPKLKDYQRSPTVRNVLQRIEYSSYQIDSYYHHSSSSTSTRMRMSTFP